MSVYSVDQFTVDGRLRGSYVYMLLCRDAEAIYIKVGRSASPLERLSALRTACPITPEIIAIVEVSTRRRAGQVELALHAAFHQWRTNGEWFQFNEEDQPQFNAAWRPVLERYSDASRRLKWQKFSVPTLMGDRRHRQYSRLSFTKRGNTISGFKVET